MCKIRGHIVRWMFGGVLYGILEIIWRGYTHWTMMLLAALVCVPLDLANEHIPWELPLWLQALLGGLTITAAELAAGAQLLAGAGNLGLLRPAVQFPGANLPPVFGPLVCPGLSGHRGL